MFPPKEPNLQSPQIPVKISNENCCENVCFSKNVGSSRIRNGEFSRHPIMCKVTQVIYTVHYPCVRSQFLSVLYLSAYLEGLRVEQTVDGLRDVGRVDVVVVGHRAMVVVLEGQAEGDQGAGIYLELAQQVPLLEQEVQQGYTNPLQRPQV